MSSRRNFLKQAAMLAGASGAQFAMPASVLKAMAIAPDPGTTWEDAEHVVILMQENRSFDHSLGTLQGVRGFNDPRAVRQANGNSIFLQTSGAGETFQPWRLDIKDTKITWMGSIPHTRNSQVDAWNAGHHNAWIDAKRPHNKHYLDVPITMGHYTREDIPFYYALADAFTVCDQNYCGVMSSTTPNRSIFWTGTIRDEQHPNSKVYMRNPEFGGGKLTWTTFPEHLSEAGVDWKIYQNDLGEEDSEEDAHLWCGAMGNMLRSFKIYSPHVTKSGGKVLTKEIETAKAELAKLMNSPVPHSLEEDRKAEIADKQSDLAALEHQAATGTGGVSSLPPKERDLHSRAFVENTDDPLHMQMEPVTFDASGQSVTMRLPKGDLFYQLRKDVQENKLATISWLCTPPMFSDHPSRPWYGAWFVSEAVDVLTSNPDVWKKTIFILTYDENDGYFDHAPSFVAADPKNPMSGAASKGVDTALEYSYAPDEIAQGVTQEEARSGPIGLGFRVPMIVASPWSRGGWVNSQVFDHSSTLQFLEAFVEKKTGKKIKTPNISSFRRAISGNLTSCFRPADNTIPKLNYLQRDPFVEGIARAKYKEIPSNFHTLTADQIKSFNKDPRSVKNAARQEPGTRPACALPYELYCDAAFIPDHKVLAIEMQTGSTIHGDRSAGAPFNVYLRNTAKPADIIARGTNNQNMHVATFALKPGDTMQKLFAADIFAGNSYEVNVHGPNGFYREFGGSTVDAPHFSSRCLYSPQHDAKEVLFHVRNQSPNKLTLTVADKSYRNPAQTHTLAAGEQKDVSVSVANSHGWYDVAITAEGSPTRFRYAGRVETGAPTRTDPLMGGEVAV